MDQVIERGQVKDILGRFTKFIVVVEAIDAGTTTRHLVGEYSYDGDGGRTSKTVYTTNNGKTATRVTNYVG